METRVRTKIDADLEGIKEEVADLILDLIDEKDFHKKVSAKNSLIYMGNSVLPQLNSLLDSDNYKLRILAAKILQQIKAKESICILITLLKDDDSAIRWIAAKGLVGIGRAAIIPLLWSVVRMEGSYNLKWGAHYILSNLFNENEKDQFKTLIISLSKRNHIGIIAPVEASKALRVYLSTNKYKKEE